MSDPEIRRLARRLANIERQLLRTKQPSLGNSSIDGGALQANDDDGVLTMIMGAQFDGTNASTVVVGPPPPVPLLPLVTEQGGALRVYWDGTFVDGAVAPMDFARVLVYAEPSSTYIAPAPLDQTIIVGQFASATGGEITAALNPGVEYVVYLVTWTLAGKYGSASDAAIATPELVPDEAALEAKSTVYRQSTPPWPEDELGHDGDIGDLWFDTSLGEGQIFDAVLISVTSNVATVTSATEHGLVAGNQIDIGGVGEPFDGAWTTTAVTDNTASFDIVTADLPEMSLFGATLQGLDVKPLNHPYIWDGSTWNSTQDSAADAATTLGREFKATQTDIATLRVTALDAQGTAYAADGRVSISDYEPSPQDVEGKNEGSLWITRTRDRLNLCTNPSFEASTADWAVTGGTVSRVAASPAAGGSWAMEVTNSALAVDHSVVWNPAGAYEDVTPGQAIYASTYVDLISGLGTGVYVSIEFYDAASALVSTVDGAPAVLSVGTWNRAFVTAVAPDLATKFLIRVHNPDESDVWRLDACLFEFSERLGRYFDGASEGGSWVDTEFLSRSELDGNAIIRLFTLEDSAWAEKFWTAETIGSVNVDVLRSGIGYARPAIPVGTFDGALTADNTIAVDKMFMPEIVCSEAVTAGDLVNIFNNEGLFMVRLATAAEYDHLADGFVLDTTGVGDLVTVYTSGYNPLVTGMTPGNQFLSTTSGKATNLPPSDVGTVIQKVGNATDDTTLNFAAHTAVSIT